MRRRGLVIGLLTLALTATLLAFNPSAQAAPDTTDGARACGIVRGQYRGETAVCGWYTDITYQRRKHTFVTGSDRQIYLIWQRYQGDPVWSGWRSLGGWGNSKPVVVAVGSGLHLRVLGAGFRYYCKTCAPANGWSAWYGC